MNKEIQNLFRPLRKPKAVFFSLMDNVDNCVNRKMQNHADTTIDAFQTTE